MASESYRPTVELHHEALKTTSLPLAVVIMFSYDVQY